MIEFRTARVAPEKAVFRPALPLRSSPGSNGTDMTKMTYGEQLKHPNWQRKRLEALERAGWVCERCCGGEVTLHVHHKHYVKGRMAWEYSQAELAVLCEDCHEEEHQLSSFRSGLLARLEMDGPLGIDDFMAYGAGAMPLWLAADDGLKDMLQQAYQDKPRQYMGGALGSAILDLRQGANRFSIEGLTRLLALLGGAFSGEAPSSEADFEMARASSAFIFEFVALAERFGVTMTAPRRFEDGEGLDA